jgi:hypothetical protein
MIRKILLLVGLALVDELSLRERRGTAAMVNYRFMPNGVWTAEEAVVAHMKAAASG